MCEKAHLSTKDVFHQIKLDISGKEVQEAATYSYYWLAGQVAHTGLLIAVYILVINLVSWLGYHDIITNNVIAIAAIVVVAIFEILSVIRVKKTESRFPTNIKGIMWNGFIAALYMWIGVGIGWAANFNNAFSLLLIFALIYIFLWFAIPELKRKIIWQKAGLPYLCRLSTANVDINDQSVNDINKFVSTCKGEKDGSKQIILFGDIGKGRTRLASAIATEAAFDNVKVRYSSFDKLVELMKYNRKYPGPKNINYWHWSDCSLMVIDDVEQSLSIFNNNESLTREELNSDDRYKHLVTASSVWVVGDVENRDLWIERIKLLCQSDDPYVVTIQ